MQNDYIIINHDTETVLMYFVYVKTSFYVLTIDKEIKKNVSNIVLYNKVLLATYIKKTP